MVNKKNDRDFLPNMISTLKITQISDIHISEDEKPYQGISVRENFMQTLKAALQSPPDLFIISGDLAAHRGEPGAYQWLGEQLDKLQVPVILIPGNHDHLPRMNSMFELPHPVRDTEYYFLQMAGDLPLVFLDSSRNEISQRQIQWLSETANELFPREILLFMHHPPLKCDCMFMDENYPLNNYREMWQALRGLENIKHIFCGHYHTSKQIRRDGKNIYLCPSTMMQLCGSVPHFEIESRTPAWRNITWDGNLLTTEVIQLSPVHE